MVNTEKLTTYFKNNETTNLILYLIKKNVGGRFEFLIYVMFRSLKDYIYRLVERNRTVRLHKTVSERLKSLGLIAKTLLQFNHAYLT